jgi:hypothetical protein
MRAANILSLILIVAATAFAQGRPSGAGPPPVNNPKLENADRDARQNALRGAEIDATSESKQQRLEAAIVQVRKDFTHLQVVRNQIAHNLVAKNPLDFDLISEQTKDINKTANRLKTFMMPRPTEEKDKVADKEQKSPAELPTAEMTAALVRLCKTIDSFVENPALKSAVDVEHLDKVKEDKSKADNDLLTIIELSENIQKSAENLKKTPK